MPTFTESLLALAAGAGQARARKTEREFAASEAQKQRDFLAARQKFELETLPAAVAAELESREKLQTQAEAHEETMAELTARLAESSKKEDRALALALGQMQWDLGNAQNATQREGIYASYWANIYASQLQYTGSVEQALINAKSAFDVVMAQETGAETRTKIQGMVQTFGDLLQSETQTGIASGNQTLQAAVANSQGRLQAAIATVEADTARYGALFQGVDILAKLKLALAESMAVSDVLRATARRQGVTIGAGAGTQLTEIGPLLTRMENALKPVQDAVAGTPLPAGDPLGEAASITFEGVTAEPFRITPERTWELLGQAGARYGLKPEDLAAAGIPYTGTRMPVGPEGQPNLGPQYGMPGNVMPSGQQQQQQLNPAGAPQYA